MIRYNTYTIDTNRFDSKEEFSKHLGIILTNLTDDGYIATVRYEDAGIYVIEYNHQDRSFGTPYPYWLSPEEEETVKYEDEEEA